jgi:hypothetical protein
MSGRVAKKTAPKKARGGKVKEEVVLETEVDAAGEAGVGEKLEGI